MQLTTKVGLQNATSYSARPWTGFLIQGQEKTIGRYNDPSGLPQGGQSESTIWMMHLHDGMKCTLGSENVLGI
jgi:hypothetical protein